MPRCPGCQTECRGQKGLFLHLSLTSNDTCSAIFRAAESHVGNAPPTLAVPNPVPELEHEQPQDYGLPKGQTVFAGDFFGENYTAGDFPEDLDDESDNSGDESDNDPLADDREAAIHADLEGGYEAPRVPLAFHGDGDQDAPMPALDVPVASAARKIAEDKTTSPLSKSSLESEADGDPKRITKAFRHILEDDQKLHGKNDVVLDDTAVNEFQQAVNDFIDIGVIDVATSVQADDS
ncbi:hypothetical protein B0H14DRAFT_2599710 [Mycena olivaceomarginata]|nr:hypothetical protein B0H14DRAFT_2599710 [Mycena olivaceomarginata]